MPLHNEPLVYRAPIPIPWIGHTLDSEGELLMFNLMFLKLFDMLE
jgi:hypothetical protein